MTMIALLLYEELGREEVAMEEDIHKPQHLLLLLASLSAPPVASVDATLRKYTRIHTDDATISKCD